MKDLSIEIAEHTLEYFDDEHLYLVDGLIVPSITQILNIKFGKKYDGVNRTVLKKAADAGTRLHEAIENYCNTGEIADLVELRNFIFLKKRFQFEVLQTEVPVILFLADDPIAAGRLDMVLQMRTSYDSDSSVYFDTKIGGADIKRTSTLDKEYLAYQLNLYRIAYRQSYGIEWEFLRGIHLREDKRKFVEIPIAEDLAWQLVHEYLKGENHE